MGVTFITIVTILFLSIGGKTRDTREDLTCLGSPDEVGSHSVSPVHPGGPRLQCF